jgi:hypothetical protein
VDSLRKGSQSGRSIRSDRRSSARRFALIASLAAAIPAFAGEPRIIKDVRDVATAPVHWRAREWTRFGEGVALVLAVHAADDDILHAVQRNHHDTFAKRVTPFGGGRGDEIAMAMIAGGWLAHDDRLRNSGAGALESSIMAATITKIGKKIARRERPDGSDNQSFPSGHATTAFALATAISNDYGNDHRAVPIIAYTLATSVAFARMNDNVHFPSDVVAGALIGRAVAKAVTHGRVAVVPVKRGFVARVTF